jgi:hypothetical protein
MTERQGHVWRTGYTFGVRGMFDDVWMNHWIVMLNNSSNCPQCEILNVVLSSNCAISHITRLCAFCLTNRHYWRARLGHSFLEKRLIDQ